MEIVQISIQIWWINFKIKPEPATNTQVTQILTWSIQISNCIRISEFEWDESETASTQAACTHKGKSRRADVIR